MLLKCCVRYIFFTSLFFLSLKEITYETRKNVFYFTSRALFVFEKIKVDNIKYSSFMMSPNSLA